MDMPPCLKPRCNARGAQARCAADPISTGPAASPRGWIGSTCADVRRARLASATAPEPNLPFPQSTARLQRACSNHTGEVGDGGWVRTVPGWAAGVGNSNVFARDREVDGCVAIASGLQALAELSNDVVVQRQTAWWPRLRRDWTSPYE